MSTVSASSSSWRSERPVLGAVLLMVSGLIVGYVPIQFTFELILIGGAFTAIGLVFAVLIFLTGVFALLRPDLSTILGIAGVAFSILSVVGALGGLLVGLLIGIVGSNLLIAWQPPGEQDDYTAATTTTTPAGASGGDFGWQEGASTGAGTTAPTTTGTTGATGSTGSTGGDFDWQEDHATQTSTGQTGTGAGTGTGTGTGAGADTGGVGDGVDADTPFEEPVDSGPTGGSDSDTQFGWQDDPDAQTGTGGEDVGVEFDAERQPTMESDEDDDEDDEDDDDRVDFSWSDD